MNKKQLIEKMVEKTGLSKKDTELFLKSFIETVEEELKDGGKIQLVGFGSFEVVERAARKGRNPRTKEEIDIPASKAPKFKPASAFKKLINE